MSMYLYCGKCGRELSASLVFVSEECVEIAYYCEACRKLMATMKYYFEDEEK